jgi:hypothetical protein
MLHIHIHSDIRKYKNVLTARWKDKTYEYDLHNSAHLGGEMSLEAVEELRDFLTSILKEQSNG